MRAKKVNENISFERGKDPKKTIGIGLDCKRYIELELEKKGFPKDAIDEFWDLYYEGFEPMSKEEVGDHVIWILDKGDPKNMKEYMDGELENYIQMKTDFGEMP